MVETETPAEPAAAAETLLDPFSFFKGIASRIEGLGGDTAGHDHTYAFHTEYVTAAPGRAHFTLRFDGLSARRGTLQLWVHMLPDDSGAYARVVNSERIQLNRLILRGGQHAIPFESFRGVRFALHGAIVDNTDAHAQSLVVALDRPGNPLDDDVAIDARTSSYGRDSTRPAIHLISTAPATLMHPVSQCATAGQLRERFAASEPKRLGIVPTSAFDQWRLGYLVRVLDCYGMIASGANGLCIEARPSAVAAALRRLGPDVEAASLPDDDDIDQNPALILTDMVNFDFVLTSGVASKLASPRAMNAFAEAVVNCLRPGGLVVHLLPYDPNAVRQPQSDDLRPYNRNDIEQLALMMISRGHEIAQLKIDAKGAPRLPWRDASGRTDLQVSEFGFIARRAPSAL